MCIDQSQSRISEESPIVAIHKKTEKYLQPNWPARLDDMLLYKFFVILLKLLKLEVSTQIIELLDPNSCVQTCKLLSYKDRVRWQCKDLNISLFHK